MQRNGPKFASRTFSAALVVAAVVAGAGQARAQGDNAFMRGRGNTDVALTYAYDSYDHFWMGSTKVHMPMLGEITRESLNLWVSHGIADDLDLVATASYVDAEADGFGNFSDNRQLQDGSIGAKWRAFDERAGPGSFTLCLAPSAKIPLSHYEANYETAIGDGQIDYRGRAILQYGADCGAWLAVESGFDYRTEGPGNEIPLNVTLGIPLFGRATLMPFYSMVTSNADKDIGQTSFPKVEEEWQRWGISLYVRATDKIGVTLGWKDTLDGKNTGDSTTWWGGVVFRLGR